MNDLIKLIEKFPDKPWSHTKLAQNPNISFEYMDEHPEWNFLCQPNVALNPNLTLDYILCHPEKQWNWRQISANPGITLKDIEDNLDLLWDWEFIGLNPNITMEFILRHINNFKDKHSTYFLGSTSNITFENIQQYPDLFWNTTQISKNPHVTFDYIFDNLDIRYTHGVFIDIVEKLALPFQDIIDKCINKYPHLLEDKIFWTGLSKNPNITIDIIRNNNNYCWNFEYICMNPSISIEDAKSFCRCRYDISSNPNITYEWVTNNLRKIDWYKLSSNKFMYAFDQPIIIRI